MKHPNRLRTSGKYVPADEVKYHAARKDIETHYTVQYMYPDDEKRHFGRFMPDWLNKWCRHSRHAKLETAIKVFMKEYRDGWKAAHRRCRIIDKDGNIVNVCSTCGDLKHGELCRREFVDFITGTWIHV
jgi:hypothetical protein